MICPHALRHLKTKLGIRVSRDYEIEIDLAVDIEQLGLLSEEPLTAEMSTEKTA